MRFLGKVFLLTLLCASGAWLVALIWAFVENAQPVDFDSPMVRFLSFVGRHQRLALYSTLIVIFLLAWVFAPANWTSRLS
jgi:hypothetical protein